jgi:hypothetical protein
MKIIRLAGGVPTVFVLGSCLLGCGTSTTSPAKQEALSPGKQDALSPKAFTDAQYQRVRDGLASINLGRMLIQRTHPTGTYTNSNAPSAILSADREEMIAKVTVSWMGSVTKAAYQTDFTVEISKNRIRLSVDRDTALINIDPNQLKLAEKEVADIVRPLL